MSYIIVLGTYSHEVMLKLKANYLYLLNSPFNV